jgi:diacylglycerol kinase family enzyme
VNASVGLYAKLLADREEVKERFGRKRWIAFLAALKTLLGWRQKLSLDAELDGEMRRIVTASLFICNNRMQLERVGIDPAVADAVGRGYLAGIVSRPLSTGAKLRLFLHALIGRLGAAPEIDAFTVKSLTVSNRHARRFRVALDGEVRWMELPLRISVAPRPLRLLMRRPAEAGGQDDVW